MEDIIMGENVSLIDGHIDNEIKQTNYDRIRNMTVEEMTKNLTKLFYEVARYTNAKDYIKQYLESEVTE